MSKMNWFGDKLRLMIALYVMSKINVSVIRSYYTSGIVEIKIVFH